MYKIKFALAAEPKLFLEKLLEQLTSDELQWLLEKAELVAV
ncbi:hypothetical protein [Nostoc punctiforme]|nr:hypothetical protein [Nostoc punctiforme]